MSRKDDLIKLADKYGKVRNLHNIENVSTCVGRTLDEGQLLADFLNDCDALLNLAMDMDCELTSK